MPVGGTSTKQSGQIGRARSAAGVGRGALGARGVDSRRALADGGAEIAVTMGAGAAGACDAQ